MNKQFYTSKQSISCAASQASLADYVRSELNGDNVTTTWASVAHHVETCAACAALYFAEFRQQGRQRSLAELRSLGERHRSASVIDNIVAQPAERESLADTTLLPDMAIEPSWSEQLIQHGRLWLEQGSDQVRQLSVALGELLTPIQPNAATSGLMSGASTSVDPASSGQLSGVVDLPAQSGLEVKVIAEPIGGKHMSSGDVGDNAINDADELLYQVQVAVTLMDRLGDYSGVGITLRWDSSMLSAETDATGIAKFDQLHATALSTMNLIVSV